MRKILLMAIIVSVCWRAASADPCGSGTLDITASSDTPVTLPTFNVGQMVRLQAVASGITLTSLSWTIDGPLIKDYNERVGEASTGALSWTTTNPSAADLATSPITFYWLPSPSQVFPLNGGPVSRNVTLTANVTGATCTVTKTYMVERNSTDPRKQATDFYTSNHAAPTETIPGKGIVIDDHLDWHEVATTRLFSDLQDFFRFHRSFLSRFNSWRAEFGYGPIIPWYPGNPYPPGIDDVAFAVRSSSFSTDTNQLFRPFTIAGGNPDPNLASFVSDGSIPFVTEHRLTDFTDANALDQEFEFSYHGFVHCNVGTGTLPPGGITFDDPVFGPEVFGDVCNFTSPKDPIFFPWHGFVDLVYENLCVLNGLTCSGTPPSSTNVWMADNAADIADNGTVPSPGLHYISPDIWNRTVLATCTPADAGSGVTRNCGSSADHENPIAGTTNYLYATLRNDRPSATTGIYTEVAIYIANASTGLAWPVDFGGPPAGIPLDESRHFITINLAPGTTTSIGPLPWTPPNPSPSDHWCLYIRVLDIQDPPSTETADIDSNTANSNDISWRNLKIVTAGGMMKRWPFPGFDGLGAFVVRNVHPERTRVDLTIFVPAAVAKPGSVRLQVSRELANQIRRSKAELVGFHEIEKLHSRRDDKNDRDDDDDRDHDDQAAYVPLRLVGEKAEIHGIELESGKAFPAAIDMVKQKLGVGEIVIEQRSGGKTDGGIVLQFKQ